MSALGIDLRALIFQVINFAVLLTVLRVVAYKPILAILDARRDKIEESLKNAADAERLKKEMEIEQHKLLAEARLKAQEIIEVSREQSKTIITEAEIKAHARGEEILKQAEQRISQEIVTARDALRHEMVGLVVAATGKLIDEKIDPQKDEALIKKALAKVRV